MEKIEEEDMEKKLDISDVRKAKSKEEDQVTPSPPREDKKDTLVK